MAVPAAKDGPARTDRSRTTWLRRATADSACSSLDTSEVVLNTGIMTSTATFSALLRTPNEVIDQLEGGDVLLTRRDAEPLRLSKARPAEQEVDTLTALAQLIAASLDDAACDRLVEKLADPFPWIAVLPAAARRSFVLEFLATARACAAVGRFERLTIALAAWKGTAEVYADPAIALDGSDLDYLDEQQVVGDPHLV